MYYALNPIVVDLYLAASESSPNSARPRLDRRMKPILASESSIDLMSMTYILSFAAQTYRLAISPRYVTSSKLALASAVPGRKRTSATRASTMICNEMMVPFKPCLLGQPVIG